MLRMLGVYHNQHDFLEMQLQSFPFQGVFVQWIYLDIVLEEPLDLRNAVVEKIVCVNRDLLIDEAKVQRLSVVFRSS